MNTKFVGASLMFLVLLSVVGYSLNKDKPWLPISQISNDTSGKYSIDNTGNGIPDSTDATIDDILGNGNSTFKGLAVGNLVTLSLTVNGLLTSTDLFVGGKVGIGTSSPSSKLEVASNGLPLMYLRQTASSGADASMKIRGSRNACPSCDVAYIDLSDYDNNEGSGGTDFTMARISAGMDGVSGQKGYLRIYTNSGGSLTEKMRIDKDGNVGIGTTNPNAKLDVKGDTVTFQLSNGRAHTWFPYTDGEVYITGYSPGSGTGDIHLRVDDGTKYKDLMIVKGDTGNVGIGTTNPQVRLDVNGGFKVTGSVDLPSGSIVSDYIASGAINSTHIKNGEVKTEDIDDGAITLNKLSDSACNDNEILKKVGGSWTCVPSPNIQYVSLQSVEGPIRNAVRDTFADCHGPDVSMSGFHAYTSEVTCPSGCYMVDCSFSVAGADFSVYEAFLGSTQQLSCLWQEFYATILDNNRCYASAKYNYAEKQFVFRAKALCLCFS